MTLPLEITVSASDGGSIVAPAGRVTDKSAIDPDYAARKGRTRISGSGDLRVPLKSCSKSGTLAALNRQATGRLGTCVPTTSRSSSTRSAASTSLRPSTLTARAATGPSGEPDKWVFDPRLPEDERTGTRRIGTTRSIAGIVRRLDPAWGPSHEAAKSSTTTPAASRTAPGSTRTSTRTSQGGGAQGVRPGESHLSRLPRVTVFTGPVLALGRRRECRGRAASSTSCWKVVVHGEGKRRSSRRPPTSSARTSLIKGLEISHREALSRTACQVAGQRDGVS